MNHGALIFLGVLASFLTSWWALVFSPNLKLGSQPLSQLESGSYPVRRLGLAEQGREVYVANGCVQCHSQQVRQEGYTFNLLLNAPGTNAADVAKIVSEIAPAVKPSDVGSATEAAPLTLLTNVSREAVNAAVGRITEAGGVAVAQFVPLGADISRGWGNRLSVAADYLYDQPVQVGNSRLGPDLSNVGVRSADLNTTLIHLYDPRTTVKGSIMPAYRFLFEVRKIGKHPSPDALKNLGEYAPKEPGHEVVPKAEALQLAAYLRSLRLETPLFEAPAPVLTAPQVAQGTNAPVQ